MRSPWKLITGIVSRGKSELSDETEREIQALPGSRAGEAAVPLPATQASPHSIIDPAEETPPTGPSIGSVNGLARVTSLPELRPISGLASTDDIEPVLATTIRLVTKDRLSVRAELSASTAALDALETHAPDISLIANVNGDEKPTEPTDLLKTDVGYNPDGTGQTTQIERTDVQAPAHETTGAKRPIRVKTRNTRGAAKVSPKMDSISEPIRLENEINELREQLAQKLRIQNEQLKAMLSRFDAY